LGRIPKQSDAPGAKGSAEGSAGREGLAVAEKAEAGVTVAAAASEVVDS
jgi:hypothetical protein